MKTIKLLDNLNINRYRNFPVFFIHTILCGFICILIILFSAPSILAGTDKDDPQNAARLKELQSKLDELNASLVSVNEENNAETPKQPAVLDKSNEVIKTAPLTETGSEKKDAEKKGIIENQNKVKSENYANEKKKADWIINTINNGTHKDRKYAINLILTIKDNELKKVLGEKLIEIIKNEVELEVKVKGITVAGEIKLNESMPYLIQSLNDAADVSVAAVYAIKRIGDTSAKPALIAKLKEQKFESNTNFIEALIDVLGEFKAAELTGFAAETINDIKTDQIVRELLVIFLGKTESVEPKDLLISLLKDEDEKEQIRAFAANSLGNLKITGAVPDIEKAVETIDSYSFIKKKQYYNLYLHCIAALVKLGDEKAFPMLVNALRSDNAVIRLKAVSLIKGMNDKRSIDILKYKMQYDPSKKVQNASKEALKELGVNVDSTQKEDSKQEIEKKYNIKKEDENKDESPGE